MAVTRMGYERGLYYGVAGSTAATQLTNVIDLDFNVDIDRAETTTRGDGTAVPIYYSKVVKRNAKISWGMRYKAGDTSLVTMRAAAKAGTAVALKITEYSGGGTLFDGDVTLVVQENAPLGDGTGFKFDAECNDDLRAATF